jgi:hypothetical protein
MESIELARLAAEEQASILAREPRGGSSKVARVVVSSTAPKGQTSTNAKAGTFPDILSHPSEELKRLTIQSQQSVKQLVEALKEHEG